MNFFVNIIYDVNPQLDPRPNDNGSSWRSAYNEGINNEAIPDSLLGFMDIAGNLNGFITRMFLLQMGRWGDKSTMTVPARKPESIACCLMRLRVKPITRNDEKNLANNKKNIYLWRVVF